MKIAVITGASRGLGRSMATQLSRAGWGVVGTYRHRKDEADTLIEEIASTGGAAAMLPLDASDTASFADFAHQLRDTVEATFDRHRIDALVNNAGTGVHAPFVETTEQHFDDLVAVQLKGPFFLTQCLLPLLADGGRILNVSSGLARFTLPGYAAYAATKGAIEVLTRYQAKELGPRRVRVNVLAPGAIETDFGDGLVRDNAALNQAVAETIPLGRVGLPDDIGRAVAALLSDGLAWANGTRIEVSGGQNT